MEINEAQQRALMHKSGPMLVLAGPGSGKTLVITRRTKYLIEECGINPAHILVITFTKAAAIEMKERFLKLMEGAAAPVTFGTFHAVYFHILKAAYGFQAKNILRDEQRVQFLKEIINNLELEIEDEGEFISGITSEISTVKNDGIMLEHYYSVNCSEKIFRAIYEQYEKKLRESNLIDFDDMLVMCYDLLKARQDILKIWQGKYRYILIDEFQDINKVQYETIRLLAQPEDNLFIVGDDDQSIYRFRGAKPDIMLNFGNDYKEAETVLLDTNYRSTKNIVSGAMLLIKNNKKRYAKNIKTVKENGSKIEVKVFETQQEENDMIISKIREKKEEGSEYSDFAVLFRTNTQPRALIQKLLEYNIPFRMRDEIPNLYNHWIAKDLFAYIRTALGSRERADFLQILNRPKRYINRKALTESIVSFDKLREYFADKDWMIERIDKFEFDLRILEKANPYSAVQYIRKGVGYDEYLVEYAKFRRMQVQDLYDILEELQASAKQYKTFEEWFQHIEDYSQELKQQMKRKDQNENCVVLTTMHSSKGLEYNTVFVIDVNEEITPHRKASTEADLEEERRLFYVAMTRAKTELYLCSVKERFGKKLSSSRFIGEILIDRDLLTAGKDVYHEKYKEGIIKRVDDGKLTIYFKKPNKSLVFSTDYCIGNHIIKLLEENENEN